jgi:hypothetical protein
MGYFLRALYWAAPNRCYLAVPSRTGTAHLRELMLRRLYPHSCGGKDNSTVLLLKTHLLW